MSVAVDARNWRHEDGQGASSDPIAREFVKVLAADIVGGRIDLPSPSAVVVRVRKALADPEVTPERLGSLIATEPSLAARVIQLANSVALNPAGNRVTTLQRAIARVGLGTVRFAALSFAVGQLRKLPAMASVASELERIWLRSVATAATACAIARRSRASLPDEALLAGLMIGVGRLYILSRAAGFKGLPAASAAYGAIVEDWQADAAKAVLASWDMPEAIVQAVHRHGNAACDHEGPPDLTDILITANALVEAGLELESVAAHVVALPAAQRLAFSAEAWTELLVEAQDGAQDLIAALNG